MDSHAVFVSEKMRSYEKDVWSSRF